VITRYGLDNAFILLGIAAALLLLGAWANNPWIRIPGIALGVLLAAFTLWFFRDSERPLSEGAAAPNAVAAPADGQITEITPIAHDPVLGAPATQITIFLSPLNLHVNRYPVSGTVTHAQYIPGKYLMAFNPKASEENERSVFVVRTAFGDVLYRQITGFLARRIVYDTKVGDVVRVGDRFGMMKFGSRMDILVPPGSEILVSVGENVTSAHTVLARLPRGKAD
jgi:phosphatidylserine decarboxylase